MVVDRIPDLINYRSKSFVIVWDLAGFGELCVIVRVSPNSADPHLCNMSEGLFNVIIIIMLLSNASRELSTGTDMHDRLNAKKIAPVLELLFVLFQRPNMNSAIQLATWYHVITQPGILECVVSTSDPNCLCAM